MEAEHRDYLMKQIPVFKLDGRKNKMEFIRGFRQVADHFGITRMIFEDVARPAQTKTRQDHRHGGIIRIGLH